MIDELHVHDVALIRDATIRPSEGLTVLTGETGAGKTALLSSIKLLVGDRADAGKVREGAPALLVEGRVYLPGEDPDGMVVRRRVGADGRGRVEVDGSMASVRELARRVGSSVDLCGQHEHQRLLSTQAHAAILDAWTGEAADAALAEYRDALAAQREAADELERVRELARTADERLDQATFVLQRIDGVAPQEGELDELEALLGRSEHAEALMTAAAGARELLSGDDGACDAVSQASRDLADASRHDAALAPLADALSGALAELEDVSATLRSYVDDLEFDPTELDRQQSRMSALQGLLRSFGPTMADVERRRAEAAEVVAAASDGGEAERIASEELERCEARLVRAADALDGVRREAAPRLAAAVSEQMGRLQMGTAEVCVEVTRLDRGDWSASGPSRVELLYRPAAGLAARPLRKIASGGEVSRVMLACKVALGAADDCETLVFDEVDAGVGGATAVALAAVLADLAHTHQVIVVTHLAQVAVVAERHYLVSKSAGDVPETTLRPIEGEERVAEVARMLSGSTDEASLGLARTMLDQAGRD